MTRRCASCRRLSPGFRLTRGVLLKRSRREFDLGTSDLILGSELQLFAIRALVQPPRKQTHPGTTFDAI
ncbi:unnamed protein product [Brugia timori]|uniref:Uncharacterized protein n=1 Tax=Brugia timori TaxID=42155 RepID=A0A0R3QHR0_9BILA|nr:unnamed protein product [Brugia timori]